MKTIAGVRILFVLGIWILILAQVPSQSQLVVAQSSELPEVWATDLAWNEAEAKVAAGYTDG